MSLSRTDSLCGADRSQGSKPLGGINGIHEPLEIACKNCVCVCLLLWSVVFIRFSVDPDPTRNHHSIALLSLPFRLYFSDSPFAGFALTPPAVNILSPGLVVLSPPHQARSSNFITSNSKGLFSLLLGCKLRTGRADSKPCKPRLLLKMPPMVMCGKFLIPCSRGRRLMCINLTPMTLVRQRWL